MQFCFSFREVLGTVEKLWIKSDELKFHSDGDISDYSEIWSDYGDEVTPLAQPKMTKWNPSRKNVSEKLSSKDRCTGEEAEKSRTRKKKLPYVYMHNS